MSFSIRLTQEERKVAESYARLHSMSISEAFKRALFDVIEDEYDVALAQEAHKEYVEGGRKSVPAKQFWEELGI